jgi:hypothetical protein
MIEQYVIVPAECSDDDKFNDTMAYFKGLMTQKYAGKEVHIVAKAVKKVHL